MTPIRPNPSPLETQAARLDPAWHAAQRAFFAMATGQAQALPTESAKAAPTQRTPGPLPAEAPAKPLRPGSLLDIRV